GLGVEAPPAELDLHVRLLDDEGDERALAEREALTVAVDDDEAAALAPAQRLEQGGGVGVALLDDALAVEVGLDGGEVRRVGEPAHAALEDALELLRRGLGGARDGGEQAAAALDEAEVADRAG